MNPNKGTGPAPEAAQAMVRAQLEADRLAGYDPVAEEAKKAVKQEPVVTQHSRWWAILPGSNVPELFDTKTLQLKIAELKRDVKITSEDQTTGWHEASELGFIVNFEFEEQTDAVEEAETGIHASPAETHLETYPDKDLQDLAKKSGLWDGSSYWHRAEMVKALAKIGVS